MATDFDPTAFAQSFAEAGADSVTVFAKCHHGMLYLDTEHPARHPGLPSGLGLVEQQVEALHAVGIKAPVYLSVQVDEYAANEHPEWVALDPELGPVKRGASAFEAGWQVLDMSSPYQDYVADQLDLVLRRLAPLDGVFLDMCWDQPSIGRWALAGMRAQGFDPEQDTDRRTYARTVARGYMTRFRDMIVRAHRRTKPASIFFNSRPRLLADEERDLVTHQEIEALPTGGWGYSYAPYIARLIRGFGIPAFGMTGRFHASWGDNAGLKPAAALTYECTQLMALGLGVSVGDVLHPRGRTHSAAIRLIKRSFDRLIACEPYTEGASVLSEVALLVAPESGPSAELTGSSAGDWAQTGAVRALQQQRQQFDVVLPDADLGRYRLVVVPDSTPADRVRGPLRSFLLAGGSVLIAGAALSGADRTPILGDLDLCLEGDSPYSHTFLRPGSQLSAALADRGIDAAGDADLVMYERGLRIRAGETATVLAKVVEPYFERRYDRFCGHSYTPPGRLTEYAGIAQQRYGEGRLIAVAEPIFESFARHGNIAYSELVGCLLDRLLPDPLVRAGGPRHLETAVHRQGTRTVVHLVSFLPARQGSADLVYDPFPLVDVPVSIRMPSPPASVRLEPDGEPLSFDFADGYLRVRVTSTAGHALVVLE